jgi:RHS repeat-associated protein
MGGRNGRWFKRQWIGGLSILLFSGLLHAGTHHYYYTDPQGTVLAKADANGNIIATYDYAPYGTAVASMNPAPNGPGYTGHVNDPDTGLVYMQARYYDPAVARFLSTDPSKPSAGNAFTFNRYAYASNNPIGNIDPNGKQTIPLANKLGTDDPHKIYTYLAAQNRVTGDVLDAVNAATQPMLAAQPEIGAALEGLESLPMVLSSVADAAGTAEVAGAAVRGGSEVPLPEGMILARGGNAANQTADKIDAAIGPSRTPGVSGFSVQCGMCTSQAGANIRNPKMGVTTVGDVRAAGGDAIATPGYGNHATVTGLTGEQASPLLQVVKNPNPSTN